MKKTFLIISVLFFSFQSKAQVVEHLVLIII